MAGTAGRDRGYDTYFARAILEARSTLHVSYRLLVRFVLVAAVAGAATAGAGLWHYALPFFVVLDLAVWRVLRRTAEFGLRWRLVLDAADIAFWSLSPLPPNGHYDAAVLIGIPLAVEAGFRLGVRGLVVPGVVMVVVSAVRLAAGRPPNPFTVGWLVLGVGVGAGLYAYCRRLHDEAERERARHRAAERHRAYLAGQNSVAMGASSVVDAIEGIVPVVGRPRPGSALWRLGAGWKAQLGDRTREEVTYLQAALLEWERAHNDHPDLRSLVELHVEEGHGTALVTAPQVDWLFQALDALGLHGPLRVRVVDADAGARLPGRPLRLRVGPHTLRVPADPHAVQRPVDPAPVMILLIAAQHLTVAIPGVVSVPRAVVGIVLSLAAGWFAHRTLVRRGRAARPVILVAAVSLGVALSAILVVTAPGKIVGGDGNLRYQMLGVMLLAYVGGIYRHGLPRPLLALLVAGLAVSVVLSVALFPAPFHLRSALCGFALSFAPYFAARAISGSLGRATEEHARAHLEEDRAATETAFRQGRESVLALVRQAREDAQRQLRVLQHSLDPGLTELAARRLEEVDRRLGTIDAASSSSMTMS